MQAINDQFKRVHQSVQLWSFFETVKTNFGYTQDLVVKKDSAILGKIINVIKNADRHSIAFSTCRAMLRHN